MQLTSRSAFVVFILSLTSLSVFADTTLTPDMTDAYVILQGDTKKGVVPTAEIQTIVEELAAIRKAEPAVKGVHAYNGNLTMVEFELNATDNAKILTHMSQATRNEVIRTYGDYVSLNPLDTGVPEFNKLNKYYSASQMKVSVSEIRPKGAVPKVFGWITFGRPFDLDAVSKVYSEKLKPKSFGPEGIIGDGDQVFRIDKAGEPIHYVMKAGGGDCPAGCTTNQYYFFNVVRDSKTGALQVTEVAPPAPRATLWGFPDRYSVEIFSSYSDLIEKTKSPDWSLRFHAVETLGTILAFGETGLGEDDFEKDPARLALNQEIEQTVVKNSAQVRIYLAQIGKHDADRDVRQAALESIKKADDEIAAKKKEALEENPPAPVYKHWWDQLPLN